MRASTLTRFGCAHRRPALSLPGRGRCRAGRIVVTGVNRFATIAIPKSRASGAPANSRRGPHPWDDSAVSQRSGRASFTMRRRPTGETRSSIPARVTARAGIASSRSIHRTSRTITALARRGHRNQSRSSPFDLDCRRHKISIARTSLSANVSRCFSLQAFALRAPACHHRGTNRLRACDREHAGAHRSERELPRAGERARRIMSRARYTASAGAYCWTRAPLRDARPYVRFPSFPRRT